MTFGEQIFVPDGFFHVYVFFQTALHISINPEKSTVAELDHLVDNRDLQLFLNFDSESRYGLVHILEHIDGLIIYSGWLNDS